MKKQYIKPAIRIPVLEQDFMLIPISPRLQEQDEAVFPSSSNGGQKSSSIFSDKWDKGIKSEIDWFGTNLSEDDY